MEAFRNRLRHHGHVADWLTGRHGSTAVRAAATLDADSVVRRTMRDTKAHAAAPAATLIAEAAVMSPEVRRLRTKLRSEDQAQAERGAQLFLELTEPDSLWAARLLAFSDAPGTPAAQTALAHAWEAFRHDRHRALN